MHDYASNQGAGQGMLNAQALKTQPRLQQIGERFECALMEFQDLSQRLNNLADRVLGPVPEAVPNGKDIPPPSSMVGRVEYAVEGLAVLMRRLRQSTERLETL